MGDLRVGRAGVGAVEFFPGADVHLSQQGAFGHDREGAIDGGAGNGVVDGAGKINELLGGEMLGLGKRGLEDREALAGHAEALLGEKTAEFFARGGDAHGKITARRWERVNVFVGEGDGRSGWSAAVRQVGRRS